MKVYTKTVKVYLTKQQIKNYHPRRGVDVQFIPVPKSANTYIAVYSACDFDPFHPKDETFAEDINNELSQLNVLEDRIRSISESKLIPKKVRSVEAPIDDKRLDNNKYDAIRSKAKRIHTMPNGKRFALVIEG